MSIYILTSWLSRCTYQAVYPLVDSDAVCGCRYITSDSDSCACILSPHRYAKDAAHAAADCLDGGTDINSGRTYEQQIAPGIASGVINISSAQQALRHAYGFRMKLGLFDPNVTDRNREIPVTAIGSAEHHQASLDAARQSSKSTCLPGCLSRISPRSRDMLTNACCSDSVKERGQSSFHTWQKACCSGFRRGLAGRHYGAGKAFKPYLVVTSALALCIL